MQVTHQWGSGTEMKTVALQLAAANDGTLWLTSKAMHEMRFLY